MGYYTRYEITAKNPPKELVAEAIRAREGDCQWPDEEGPFCRIFASEFSVYSSPEEEQSKWTPHESLLKLSLKYPETDFLVEGVGEESEDVWADIYLNGSIIEWRPSLPPTPQTFQQALALGLKPRKLR